MEPHVVVYVVFVIKMACGIIFSTMYTTLCCTTWLLHKHMKRNFMQQRRQGKLGDIYQHLLVKSTWGASTRKSKMAAMTEGNCLLLYRQCTAGIWQVVIQHCAFQTTCSSSTAVVVFFTFLWHLSHTVRRENYPRRHPRYKGHFWTCRIRLFLHRFNNPSPIIAHSPFNGQFSHTHQQLYSLCWIPRIRISRFFGQTRKALNACP